MSLIETKILQHGQLILNCSQNGSSLEQPTATTGLKRLFGPGLKWISKPGLEGISSELCRLSLLLEEANPGRPSWSNQRPAVLNVYGSFLLRYTSIQVLSNFGVLFQHTLCIHLHILKDTLARHTSPLKPSEYSQKNGNFLMEFSMKGEGGGLEFH